VAVAPAPTNNSPTVASFFLFCKSFFLKCASNNFFFSAIVVAEPGKMPLRNYYKSSGKRPKPGKQPRVSRLQQGAAELERGVSAQFTWQKTERRAA
jgi:hypothetical protein